MLDDKTIKILYDIVIKEIHQVPYLIEKFSLSRRQFAYIIEKINAEFANGDEEKLKIENNIQHLLVAQLIWLLQIKQP